METENKTPSNTSDAPSISSLRWSLRFLFKVVLPVICVIAAVVIAIILIKTRPKAQRQKPAQQARLVTVETAQQTNHQISVSAMGKVIPAKRITLSPEVSGRIVFVNPLVIPGGAIHKGQTLLRIDARDYEAVVKQRQSEVAKAQLNLKLEQGNQLVAQQEYEMLEDIIQDQDQELVLRKPHLQEAQTALEAAKAALAKAQLDVVRCTVTAPFNAVIQDKFVDVGAQVTVSSSLLTLMGTDEYWVEAKVWVSQLHWITVPENNQQPGARVKIFNSTVWEPDTYREGRVVRLLGQLEEAGRLAQLLISVKDPLVLESDSPDVPPVLVDSFVRVEIEGITLEGVFGVKRDYLRDGDNIWIMNDDNQMEIRPVNVVFREKQMVYLSDGLHAGDRIVTTDISAPVDGMLLRLNGTSESAASKSEAANPEAQE